MEIYFENKNAREPVPATGAYAEFLQDMMLQARALIQLLERERAGVFDGIGAKFWVNRDPVLDKAKSLYDLAQTRAASLQDGSFRR